jgi:hypothetical protein
MGPIGCPETSVTSYKSMLCNIPEDRSGSLESRNKLGNSSQISATLALWVRGVAVSRGSGLQAERSRVRSPMLPLEFFGDKILPAALCSWGPTQPLSEMSTWNISLGVKAAGA